MNSRYRDTSNTAGEEDTRSRASRILPHASGSPRFGGRRLFGVLSNSRPRATFVPGGFPEEIFTDLKPHELSNYECCICYQVVCEPRECENDHMFCTACIDMWSCQSSSECRNRCPVCRAPAAGYKPSSRDAWSVLSARRVRCVEQRCSWSGQLKDYRRHLRNKHQIYMYSNTVNGVSTTRRSQPNFPVTSSLSTAGFLPVTSLSRPTMSHGWQRLESLMDAFTDQLEHRRQNVERAYQEQERARQERLEEVESLSRQLGKVASDLTVLISNMSKDTQRYKSYINTPAVTDNKQQHQQALVGDDTHESTVAPVMLPDINT